MRKTNHILLHSRPILFLNRSFWPDIEAVGQFLTELCEKVAQHHNVIVIAGRSYYVNNEFPTWKLVNSETFNGIQILRVRHTRFWKGNPIGRLLNWATYSFLAFLSSLRVRPKLIVVCTEPPFLGILSIILKWWWSVPIIYYCMDLYPEVALNTNNMKKGFVSQLFDLLNKKAMNSANIVVPIGRSMEKKIQSKGIPSEQIKLIPVWGDVEKIKPITKSSNPFLKKLGLENYFVLMYSGNIGLSQDFDSVIRALSLIKNKNIALVFIGDGAGKKKLLEQARISNLKNVHFLPYQPKEMISFSLSMADLHLIPLKKGLSSSIVPSKMYGIMAVARAYLVIADFESEPAVLAREFSCGLWANSGNVPLIKEQIEWAVQHPAELNIMGKKGRELVEHRYNKDIVIQEWIDILDRLTV